MNKLAWTLPFVLVLSACASLSPSKTEINANGTTAAAPAGDGTVTGEELQKPVDKVPVFHLNDPQEPTVVNEELEYIPTEVNPAVEMWIKYFQGRGRHHMERYLARSTRYEKLMKRVLSDNGLPEDLFYIALIESGFSSSAVSHAAAVGYWQFIRGTGKRYGLEISKMVDERRDPVLATEAAGDYFRGLYSVFGSWYLAMAAYNVGENRILREVKKHETRDFWELARKSRLPKETLNYIPKFIAAKLIARDPAKYGFEGLDYLPPIEFDSIRLEKPVNMRVMAEKMNYNYEDFKALNPMFKGEIAPLKGTYVDLRIPVGQTELAIQAASQSVAESVEFVADVDTQQYKIRRGDNLASIARRYRTTVAYLRDLNDLSRKTRLKVGTRIYVPDRRALSERKDRTAKTKSLPPIVVAGSEIAKGTTKYYVVQSGDNLSTIAKKYKTTVTELARINKIGRGKTLRVGMKLRLPEDDSKESASTSKNSSRYSKARVHVVRHGESLTQIANKYGVHLTALKKKNKIRNPSSVMAGVRLIIPAARASR